MKRGFSLGRHALFLVSRLGTRVVGAAPRPRCRCAVAALIAVNGVDEQIVAALGSAAKTPIKRADSGSGERQAKKQKRKVEPRLRRAASASSAPMPTKTARTPTPPPRQSEPPNPTTSKNKCPGSNARGSPSETA